jgi:luciferase family oxidoreductase group 1
LAAQRGLPYAFASHFAPRMLLQAVALYRSLFQPSAQCGKPYVVIGVPLVAAPTDAQAQYLASSIYQRVLGIVTGQRKSLQPPVENYLESLQPQESAAIADFLGAAAIGGPERIKRQLQHLTDITQADEIMLVCDIFDPALRLQSLDIAASVRPHRTPSIL